MDKCFVILKLEIALATAKFFTRNLHPLQENYADLTK